jgi:molecular chaperone GrpE (heat shock protein)
MLSEYKKENSSKQLARISNDLQRKQAEAQNLDTQTKSRMEELKQFDAIGFTKDEVSNLYNTANVNLKVV